MSTRPAPGTTIRYTDGREYVIAYYPTANLDTLWDTVLARPVGGKRATRLQLSACTPV